VGDELGARDSHRRRHAKFPGAPLRASCHGAYEETLSPFGWTSKAPHNGSADTASRNRRTDLAGREFQHIDERVKDGCRGQRVEGIACTPC